MHFSRYVWWALVVVSATSAFGQSPADPAVAEATRYERHHAHRVERLLSQLKLTAEQTARVDAIYAESGPQLQSLLIADRSTRDRLVSTPPTDANYAALLATAKANAAAIIQLQSDTWARIYNVLTLAQQAQIPGLIAARRNARPTQHGVWKNRRAVEGEP